MLMVISSKFGPGSKIIIAVTKIVVVLCSSCITKFSSICNGHRLMLVFLAWSLPADDGKVSATLAFSH